MHRNGFKWTREEVEQSLVGHTHESTILSDGNRTVYAVVEIKNIPGIKKDSTWLNGTLTYCVIFRAECRGPMTFQTLPEALDAVYNLPRKHEW